ncbi:MAG: alpha/beta fold hydrolase [Panacibacter sp.]
MQYLLLLHGAIGGKDQLQPLAESLSKNFIVHTLSFSGHAGNDIPAEPFSIELFANDVLQYLSQHNIEQVNIFGYSMGGYVAFYLAKYYPERILKIVTLATKVYWDEAIAAKEIKMMDANILEQKVPAFAVQLAKRHAPNNWKTVLTKAAEMLANLGRNNTLKTEDYSSITGSCLLLLGDRDKMVTLNETVMVYKQLPNAELGILPNTSHPIEQVDTALLSFMIQRF